MEPIAPKQRCLRSHTKKSGCYYCMEPLYFGTTTPTSRNVNRLQNIRRVNYKTKKLLIALFFCSLSIFVYFQGELVLSTFETSKHMLSQLRAQKIFQSHNHEVIQPIEFTNTDELIDVIGSIIAEEKIKLKLNSEEDSDNPGVSSHEIDQLRPTHSLFYADNIPDYALKSSGASIIQTINTVPYYSWDLQFSLFGLNFQMPNSFVDEYYYKNGPLLLLQSWHQPGECWMFSGTSGTVQIKLSHEIIINAVTLEHIPIAISPDQNMNSAPKQFSLTILKPNERKFIGEFTFKKDDYHIQTFSIKSNEKVSKVEFKILSNHGNPEFTCVYKIRVHGHLTQF